MEAPEKNIDFFVLKLKTRCLNVIFTVYLDGPVELFCTQTVWTNKLELYENVLNHRASLVQINPILEDQNDFYTSQ